MPKQCFSKGNGSYAVGVPTSNSPVGQTPSSTQLTYLVAALDRGGWTDAANALGVSTSAFAQGIAELERRLGIVLFTKVGRTRVPTPEAHTAARYARTALAELDALDRWASEVRTGDTGQIRAGMIDTAAIHHFGETLVRFRSIHPEISVQLSVAPSATLFDELQAGELDVVVAVAPRERSGIELRPLVSEPLYVYAPPGTSVGTPASWGPWVGFPPDSRTRSLVTSELRKRGATVNVIAESSQPAVLCEMVRLGMGWTVLSAVDAEREPHFLQRAVEAPVAERDLVLARRADRPPTEALIRFISMLMSEALASSDVRSS